MYSLFDRTAFVGGALTYVYNTTSQAYNSVSSVVSAAINFSPDAYRKVIESWVVYLKVDLQLAASCNKSRQSLFDYINNEEQFTPELVKYLANQPIDKAYVINIDDPEQVVLFKKLFNALLLAENTLTKIENINIKTTNNLPAMVAESLSVINASINPLYEALQLLNESTGYAQTILGPHIHAILPKLAAVYTGLQDVNIADASTLGSGLASAVNSLPVEEHSTQKAGEKLGALLFDLPKYLETMHQYIGQSDRKSLSLNPKELEVQSQWLQKRLVNLADANAVSALIHSPKMIKSLLILSGELMNTSSPLFEATYNRLVQELDDFRHDYMPQLLEELEVLEENLCLKPGYLTKQIVPKLEEFYADIAKKTNTHIADSSTSVHEMGETLNSKTSARVLKKAVGVKKITTTKVQKVENLEVLFDTQALQKIHHNRARRLQVVQHHAKSSLAAEVAAKRFFDKLKGLHEEGFEDLAGISQAAKNILLEDYVIVKPYLITKDPILAKQIEEALHAVTVIPTTILEDSEESIADALYILGEKALDTSVETAATVLSSVGSLTTYTLNWLIPGKEITKTGSQKQEQSSLSTKVVMAVAGVITATYNELNTKPQETLFVTALNARKTVDAAIAESQAQATFQEKLIRNTMDYDAKDAFTSAIAENIIKEEDEAIIDSIPLKRSTLFEQLKDYNLSEKVQEHFFKKLETYLHDNLSPIMFEEVFGNQEGIDESKLPFKKFNNEIPEVAIYKNLVNAVFLLKTGLEELESLHENANTESAIAQAKFVGKTLNALIFKINYAKFYLSKASNDPTISQLISEGLALIEPLTKMELIQHYLPASDSTDQSTLNKPVNIISEWEQQQKIVSLAFEGKTLPSEPKGPSELTKNSEQAPTSSETALADEKPSRLFSLMKDYITQLPLIKKATESKDTVLKTHFISTERYEPLINKATNYFSVEDNFDVLSINKQNQSETDKQAELKKKQGSMFLHLQQFTKAVNGIKIASPAFHADLTEQILEFEQEIAKLMLSGRKLSIEQLEPLKRLGFNIVVMTDNLEFRLGLKPGTLSDGVNKHFNDFYSSLLLNLSTVDVNTIIWLLESSNWTQSRLQKEIERRQLLDNAKLVDEAPLKAYQTLMQLGDGQPFFEDRGTQLVFLKDYQQLQPYLHKIKYQYDTRYFLRSLQTPADFDNAWKAIKALEPEIRHLSELPAKEIALQKRLSDERVRVLTTQLDQEKLVVNQNGVVFIEKKINELLVNSLKSDLHSKYKMPKAFIEIFTKEILSEVLAAKGKDTEGYLAKIAYANKVITLGMGMGEQIKSEVGPISTLILQNKSDVIKAYLNLQAKISELEALIQIENNKLEKDNVIDNPAHAEKLEALLEYKDKLEGLNLFHQEDPIAFVEQNYKEILGNKTLADIGKEYETLSAAQAVLMAMKAKIMQDKNPKANHTAKVESINTLQNSLSSDSEDALPERFKKANEYINDEKNKDVISELAKSEPSAWTKFCKLLQQAVSPLNKMTMGDKFEKLKGQLDKIKSKVGEFESPMSLFQKK